MTTPRTIPLASVIIPPNRQRKAFDPVSELDLARSIEDDGLFHAIQVRHDGCTLVSGERRLRAIAGHLAPLGKTFTYDNQPIPLGHIPIILASSDDPLKVREIELNENFKRRDLTWQEHARAVAELHSLRTDQRVAESDGQVQTVAETTAEVHPDPNPFRHEQTRREILISRHMDKPEVAKAPTLTDAFKALKKIEDADRNRTLAALVGETFNSGMHAVHHRNCLVWMDEQIVSTGRESFDVILTDPPYGMGADKFGDAAGRLVEIDHEYDDSYENWQVLMKAWCLRSWDIAKPQAHAYVFCDIDRFHELKGMMQDAGWYVFRTPFTNYKQNSGRVPLPDQGPRRQSEWLLYAIKGKKTVNFIGSDVIVTGSDENLTHGAQKPVALYTELLRRSVRPGDRVLDTFGGTGTLIPAAHGLKCAATVIEQNPVYYGLCLKRLEGLDEQKELVP
jgi:DNA modification methylase